MKTLKKVFYTTAIASLAFVSCKEEKPEEKVAGIALENMDKTVKPTDDFFRHVNGTWLDKTEIPDDQTSWGGFNQLRKKNRCRCFRNFR
jgi:putative endopeptidase